MSGKPTKLLIISLVVIGAVTTSLQATAALKDSDADGVTDQAESETYFTDPQNPDTDGDNVPDGDEIIHHSDPLSKEANPLQAIAQSFPEEPLPHWLLTWFASVGTLTGASVTGLAISALVRKKRSQDSSLSPQ